MALTLGQKAGWGLADAGIAVFVIVKQLLVFAFLTTELGVPVVWAGILTTGVLVFDMITDPLVGWLSDRTRSRHGRRVPWMVSGAVVMAGAIWGTFAVPPGLAGTAAVLWSVGFFVLASVGFTMITIPYGAMAGEMTTDPRERSQMTAWRMGFASVGLLVGGGVIPALATGMGHALAALSVAPLILGAVWGSVWLTRAAPRGDEPALLALPAMLRLVSGNGAFLRLVLLYGVMTLAIALITAGLDLAAKYLIADTAPSALSGAAGALGILSLMFAAFVIGSILSQAVWVILSARLSKVGALVLGLCLYVALLIWLYTLLPSGNVTVIAGVFVLAGMTNGSYQQIPWAIWPDLMDATRAATGEAIEGAFSAVWLFGQKAANALAPLVLGLILSAAGWAETTQGIVEQTPQAIEALRRAVTLIPAGILAVAAVALLVIYRPAATRLLGHAPA